MSEIENRKIGLTDFQKALRSPPIPCAQSYRPWIVQLEANEWGGFQALCRERGIGLIDAFERQLQELSAVRWPAVDQAEERSGFVSGALRDRSQAAASGNWVFFPWEWRIVHLLGSREYFEVITDRNRDKITRSEQQLLSRKRIGVVGLSVGGEVAAAAAQEHLCGRIALADFDRLDLSNLNRLQASCQDLGVGKAIIAARRIACIDPYLEVEVFEDGLTPENIDRFLEGLDLVIEECDQLEVKRQVRLKAAKRRLNLVYAADERGFLSIEPYALCPDLPPFHGRNLGPQPRREDFDDPQGFLRALTEWLGGWEGISERSRRSLQRVGSGLNGYPQLASEARFAAGQVGHVARRLLLGEHLEPFCGYLDLDSLIAPSPVGRA